MIRIVTDSISSIPPAKAAEAGIILASLYVHYHDQEFVETEMDLDDFYSKIYDMIDDIPTSSQPSQATFTEIFEKIAEAGDEALGVFPSTKMSGTFDGALRAAKGVAERYPSFRYSFVDSCSNSYDEAWPIWDAVEVRDAGGTLEECAQAVLDAIPRTRFVFTPESLAFLRAGGRIGGAAALLGNLIQLRPVLTVSQGETDTLAKTRGTKKAVAKVAQQLADDVAAFGLKHIMVHYIGDKAPAVKMAKELIEPIVGCAVEVLPVSPVIGVHVGPAVGVAYECLNDLPGKQDRQAIVVAGVCAQN